LDLSSSPISILRISIPAISFRRLNGPICP
jgi:hypothetical protein